MNIIYNNVDYISEYYRPISFISISIAKTYKNNEPFFGVWHGVCSHIA